MTRARPRDKARARGRAMPRARIWDKNRARVMTMVVSSNITMNGTIKIGGVVNGGCRG